VGSIQTVAARARYEELKRILEERRREILAQVQEKLREIRTPKGESDSHGEPDTMDAANGIVQDDIEFALIQMKSETLHHIEDALARLDASTYGNCFTCGEEITERRLRALPFTIRCKDCEERKEVADRQAAIDASRKRPLE